MQNMNTRPRTLLSNTTYDKGPRVALRNQILAIQELIYLHRTLHSTPRTVKLIGASLGYFQHLLLVHFRDAGVNATLYCRFR